MPNIIHINEPGYDRIKFVNLLIETEEMKWKILDYHNQQFVLDRIVGGAFNKEGHIEFLKKLPIMKREHYIVYFDGKAIGKYSFEIDGNNVVKPGDFLFFEEDMLTGLGLLMRAVFHKYVFEVLRKEKILFAVRKSNGKSFNVEKKMGAKIINEDAEMYYCELNDSGYRDKINKVDYLVKFMYA